MSKWQVLAIESSETNIAPEVCWQVSVINTDSVSPSYDTFMQNYEYSDYDKINLFSDDGGGYSYDELAKYKKVAQKIADVLNESNI